MPRCASELLQIRVNPEHKRALEQLADKLQTNSSQLTRLAISDLLAKYEASPPSTPVLNKSA